MKQWQERPMEVMNLFNPAFCAEIIRVFAKEYQELKNQNTPYLLLLFVLPIILNNRIRNTLPTRNGNFYNWLQNTPEILINFKELTSSYIIFTKEALLFLHKTNAIETNKDLSINVKPYIKKGINELNKDSVISDCFKKAGVLASLLAKAGSLNNIYISLGVKP